MPQDPFLRRAKVLCPCSRPYEHYRHQDTVRIHLEQDYLRAELRHSELLLPEFEYLEYNEGVAHYLESRQAEERRTQVLREPPKSDDPTQAALNIIDDLEIEDDFVSDEISEDDDATSMEEEDELRPDADVEFLAGDIVNPTDGIYDTTPVESYVGQFRLDLDAIQLCALKNFRVRMESGGSENVLHQYDKNYNELLTSLRPELWNGVLGHDKTTRLLSDLTGIKQIRFDCCKNACCAYTGPHMGLTKCPFCSEPRFRQNQQSKGPAKTFDLTSIVRKLRMMYADSKRSELLQRDKYSGSLCIEDIWDGSHMASLRRSGKFLDPRDIALGLSSDGISLFQIGTHSVWPILVTNFSLPRDTRYNKTNQMLLGVIPGPSEPKDFDSFFRPIVNELVHLESGVQAYDAFRGEFFTLRAHLILLQGDTPGLAKMINFAGSAGYHFCPRCQQVGVWHGTVRCPQIPPDMTTLPGTAAERPETTATHPLKLPMRQHKDWMVAAQFMAFTEFGSTAERRRAVRNYKGVQGFSQFLRLSSIEAPTSFVTDGMHLLFQNLVPLMFLCWGGSSFSDKSRRLSNIPAQKEFAVLQETGASNLAGFADDNAYHISKLGFLSMAEDQNRSRRTIPKSITESVPAVTSHKRYTATMRMQWMQVFSPILLKDHLPAQFYDAWVDLCLAVSEVLEPVPRASLRGLRKRIARFVIHYESMYYRGEVQRLHLCRSQVHTLLHIMDSVESFGPLDLYWQFPMERIAGRIKRKGQSRSSADRNLSLVTLYLEQLNYLDLVCNMYKLDEALETTAYSSVELQIATPAIFLDQGKEYKLSVEERSLLATFLESREPELQVNGTTLDQLRQFTTSNTVSRHQVLLCRSHKERVGNFKVRASQSTTEQDNKLEKMSNLVLARVQSTRAVVSVRFGIMFRFYGVTFRLAYLAIHNVAYEGTLSYTVNIASNSWADITEIEEPVGIVKTRGKDYLVKARSSLWEKP